MLSAGVGTQFLAIVSGILLMALLGMFNVHRHGSINAAAILLYAFTSCESSCFYYVHCGPCRGGIFIYIQLCSLNS